MITTIDPKEMLRAIKKLASEASQRLKVNSPGYHEARRRINRPIDYMRCAEFPLAFEQISLEPGMKVLDVSSPQWFSLYLASLYPKTQFYYVNLMDVELDQIKYTADCLDLKNISYHKQDVRSLEFDSDYFDKAISISVIEHVSPEVGGDVKALNEISRVLVPKGELTLSVPLKQVANVVFMDGPIYEGETTKNNFFAREYDEEQFETLVRDSNYKINQKSFIIEKTGLFALDYWEWGPGKDKAFRMLVMGLRDFLERSLGISVENKLAIRYLKASTDLQYRSVNIVATIEPE